MLKNTLKTLFCSLARRAFVAVGGLLGAAPAPPRPLIGLVLVGGSYWFSDKLALKAARSQIVTSSRRPSCTAW